MMRQQARYSAALIQLFLWVLYVIPLVWIVLTAFKSDSQILANPNSLIFAPTLSTLSGAVVDALGPLITSIQIAVGTTVLIIAVGVPAAYALGRSTPPVWGRVVSVVLSVLLALQMLPQPMTVIPLFSVLADWGLLDTIVGLVLVDAAFLLPFSVLLMRPFVMAIPFGIEEAARVDGASRFQTFRHIVLPMLSGGIATVSSLVFILAWGVFIYAITLFTSPDRFPISALLAQQTSTYGTDWNTLMALALVASLPIVVVYGFAHKKIRGGLSLGAIK